MSHTITITVSDELADRIAELILATGSVSMQTNDRKHQPLTAKDEAFWKVLKSHADSKGYVRNVGNVELGRESDVQPGSVWHRINSLGQKGYLTIVKRGLPGRPAVYRLHGPASPAKKRHLRAVKGLRSA